MQIIYRIKITILQKSSEIKHNLMTYFSASQIPHQNIYLKITYTFQSILNTTPLQTQDPKILQFIGIITTKLLTFLI